MTDQTAYRNFLEEKVKFDQECGLHCDPTECHLILKPHQRDIAAWAVRGGRRAIFSAFGLGKTVIQLEAVRLVLEKSGGGAWPYRLSARRAARVQAGRGHARG